MYAHACPAAAYSNRSLAGAIPNDRRHTLIRCSRVERPVACPKRRAERRVVWVEREDLLHVRLVRGRERIGDGLVPVRDEGEQVRGGVQVEASVQLVRRTRGTTIPGSGLTFVYVGARHERDDRDLALRDEFG